MKNLIIIVACLCFSNLLRAQSGVLDTSFDGDGVKTVDVGGYYDYGQAVAIQPDGKIVVAGRGMVGNQEEFFLLRILPNGDLDPSFDGDGIVTTDFAPVQSTAIAWAVGIQPDGKIVAAGGNNVPGYSDYAVARYNTNGSLDASFDGDGLATFRLGIASPQSNFSCIAFQGTKILLGGRTWNSGTKDDFLMLRLNANGSPDQSFGVAGWTFTDFSGELDEMTSLIVLQDGRILTGGYVAGEDLALALYSPDGILDNMFGGDGRVTPSQPLESSISQVMQQADGKIVVAGTGLSLGGYDFFLARYELNGDLDASFGNNGVQFFDCSGDSLVDFAMTALLQPDGKIVLAGGSDGHFAISRFNNDGSLDLTFGQGGVTTMSITTNEDFRALALQPDLRIVAVGSTRNGGNVDVVVARYTSGLLLGTEESPLAAGIVVFPNPIEETATFTYTLSRPGKVTIQLKNIEGKTIATYLDHVPQAMGKQELTFRLPEALPAGNYFLCIASPEGFFTVRVVH